MRILFFDSYYPQVFQKLSKVFSYDQRVEQLRALHFGTAYYYSEAFKKMGWNAVDWVANDPIYGGLDATISYLNWFNPDVIYFQDLSYLATEWLDRFRANGKKLVGQISCPWAGNDRVSKFDLVFTSFPHYLQRIKALGPQAEFLPIAFGEQVLSYVNPTARDLNVSFVGGVGGGVLGSGHWARGSELLEAVAKSLGDSFHWYGYGVDNLPQNSSLRSCYRGQAWGIEQYRVYARSKIVINRHGEVAEGFSNNMRMFEATGMGALLMTETSKNLSLYFNDGTECIAYDNEEHLIRNIEDALLTWENTDILSPQDIAKAGQERTLASHTYTKRLDEVEPHIRRLLK